MRTPRGLLILLIKCLLGLSVAAITLSIAGYAMPQAHDASPTPTFDPNSVNGFRAYGEVPIPGSEVVHLPAGKVAITLHAETVGIPGAGLPIPELKLDINPSNGLADPKLIEKYGGTTSFNNDAWRQVWIAEILQEGDYQMVTDGQVTAFVSARLAFGYADFNPPSPSMPPIPHTPARNFRGVSQVAFPIATLILTACIFALRRFSVRTANSAFPEGVSPAGAPADSAVTSPATTTAHRLEELEKLRDSGAISDAEYADKREQIIADL